MKPPLCISVLAISLLSHSDTLMQIFSHQKAKAWCWMMPRKIASPVLFQHARFVLTKANLRVLKAQNDRLDTSFVWQVGLACKHKLRHLWADYTTCYKCWMLSRVGQFCLLYNSVLGKSELCWCFSWLIEIFT